MFFWVVKDGDGLPHGGGDLIVGSPEIDGVVIVDLA